MDPNIAFTTMTDETNDIDERRDAADALVGWLAKGGYVPDALGARVAEVAPFAMPAARLWVAGYAAAL